METSRFDVIGSSYEKALAKYPNSRRDHIWLLEQSHLQKDSCVLEISGGTGFLTTKILSETTDGKVVVQDVSETVLGINRNKHPNSHHATYLVEKDMTFPTLKNEEFDSVIGLGGFHHIEDQVSFAQSMHRILKPGGRVCLGDFEDNSSMQKYFDERVHYMTETGHKGLFASESRFINLGRFAGFDKVQVERKKVAFCFKTEDEIGDFFQLVHDLNQDPKDTFEEIKKYFEIIDHNDGIAVLIDYVYALYQK